MYCPICKKKYKDKFNRKFIDNTGRCGICDHVESDNYEENIHEQKISANGDSERGVNNHS